MTSHCHTCGATTGENSFGGLCPACLLETALTDDPAESQATSSPNEHFGEYLLLGEIGRGGMGVVYRARQPSLNRLVALKIMLAGQYAEAESRHRFCTEAKAAAELQHPGIVGIYGIGECEDRLYLTMNLIEGGNLSQLCDGQPLTPMRATTFVQAIADAVQHAHEHGVLHRDLKPSNILIDSGDRPYITDFGIAKRLADSADATLTGQMLGSPNYVSPEQAAGRNASVGPATDVYGLGALLYYLLTGRPPFLAASVAETLRMVLEVDPVSPRLLNPIISRDLETVCLKCLEKDPLRRYATAHALALDLQRYLRHEPVTARPPTKTYRLVKFILRNQLAVGAAIAIVVALVGGTVISTWQAVRATRAEHRADIERNKAINERTRAIDLVSFMLGDLRELLAKVGRLDILEAVGDKAMSYLSAQDQSYPTLTRHVQALTQIGEIRLDQARYPEATAAFSEAYQRAAAAAAKNPQDGEMLFERGQAEYWNGYIQWKRGKFADANIWLTRYHDTCEALVALDPTRQAWQSELAYGQHNLAVLRQERGEFTGARADFLSELGTLKKMCANNAADLELQFRITNAHSWLGGLADQQGEFAEAINQYVTQTNELRQLLLQEPRTARWQFELAQALILQIDVALATGQLAFADARLEEACRLMDNLTAHDPANHTWLGGALNSHMKEVLLAKRRRDTSAATRLLGAVRPALERLSESAPEDRSFLLWLTRAWRLEAELAVVENTANAGSAAAHAVELGSKLVREGRATNTDIGESARAEVLAGEIASRSGDSVTAMRHWHHSAEMLANRLPSSRDWHLLDPAARVALRLGRVAEARALIAQLDSLGYVPLDPWPDSDERSAQANSVRQPYPIIKSIYEH